MSLPLRQAVVSGAVRRQCHAASSSSSTFVCMRHARRSLSHSVLRPASVSDLSVNAAGKPTASSSSSSQPMRAIDDPDKPPLERPAHLAREVLEAKRQRKVQQYRAVLLEKAKKAGYASVEEMVEKDRLRKKAAAAAATADHAASQASGAEGLTAEDAKVAAALLKRVEAEAERKLKQGDLNSGPGVKKLGDILDMAKVQADEPETIAQLWTHYHSLKNKLSAVLPARQYADMMAKARQYPQFLLPLPRTITGSTEENATANVAPGERKEGFELQYMEWGFLPKPVEAETTAPHEQLSDTDIEAISSASPATALFTPLAEYKLRQEFAQPVLILTHYTELALSKGIVLLRGEVTEGQDAASAPTGIAAAVAASQAGETSPETLDKLKKPLQSQGKVSQQDAQLLTVLLQRFYMPRPPDAAPLSGETQRQQLLDAFHGDQERFDIDLLCKCAFEV